MDGLDAKLAMVGTVLIDIGGVLYVDPWQTVLLSPDSPGTGLACRMGLDPGAVEAAALALWPYFSTHETDESDYWERLGDELHVSFDRDLVDEVSDELLHPLPQARDLLCMLSDRVVGVVTDNTTFWYSRQSRDLKLSGAVSPELEFVSSALGMHKEADPGLFGLAARRCDPGATLVIDDQQQKLDRARSLGFHTFLVSGSKNSW